MLQAGELEADKVNLLDAGYGDWAQTVARWAKDQPHAVRVEAWYTSHASQERNHRAARRIAPHLVTIHHSRRAHNAIPAHHLGTG